VLLATNALLAFVIVMLAVLVWSAKHNPTGFSFLIELGRFRVELKSQERQTRTKRKRRRPRR